MGIFHLTKRISYDQTQIQKMAAAFDMGPAGRVSPLAKTARWTLLIAGIWWGAKRYSALKIVEDANRAHEAEMAPIWAAAKAKRFGRRKQAKYDFTGSTSWCKGSRQLLNKGLLPLVSRAFPRHEVSSRKNQQKSFKKKKKTRRNEEIQICRSIVYMSSSAP